MKTLLILRHGKAESHNADGDKARLLTERGEDDADRMGKLIGDKFGKIDLITSSDAERAAVTAQIVAMSAGYTDVVVLHPEIYGASVDTLFSVVHTLPEDIEIVLLVGHNPALEELCCALSGRSLTDCTLPTCGLIKITLPGEWADAEATGGTLEGKWTP